MKIFTALIICLNILIGATLITTASAEENSDKNETIKAWTKSMLSDKLKVERRNSSANNPSKGIWFLSRDPGTGEESWINAYDYIEEDRRLNLGYLNLCGPIPANIIDLKDRITELFLDDNSSLEGDLSVLSDFTNLKKLDLSLNRFEGDLSFVKNLKNLEEINLSDNYINGDLSSFSDLTKLQVLKLGANNIVGDLSALSNLSELRELSIGTTEVSAIDDAASKPTIKGDLSPLRSLINLEHLDLSDNQLTGDLSPLAKLTKLEVVYLLGNKLTGDLSPLAKLTKLKRVDLSDNQLTGDLDDLGDQLENLSVVDVSNNRLEGSLRPPYWFQLDNATNAHASFIAAPQQNKRRRLQ